MIILMQLFALKIGRINFNDLYNDKMQFMVDSPPRPVCTALLLLQPSFKPPPWPWLELRNRTLTAGTTI